MRSIQYFRSYNGRRKKITSRNTILFFIETGPRVQYYVTNSNNCDSSRDTGVSAAAQNYIYHVYIHNNNGRFPFSKRRQAVGGKTG